MDPQANHCEFGHYEEGAQGGRCIDARLGNAAYAYEIGVRCEERGHREVTSMAREGCECCEDAILAETNRHEHEELATR